MGIGKIASISISFMPMIAIPIAALFSLTGYKISKNFKDNTREI
jgi:hypothetical protein